MNGKSSLRITCAYRGCDHSGHVCDSIGKTKKKLTKNQILSDAYLFPCGNFALYFIRNLPVAKFVRNSRTQSLLS